jgi:hypothetical protein
LYGAPKPDNVPNPSTTTTQRPAGGGDDNNDLCSDSRVDTIFSTADGSYYVFKGSDYWKLTEDSVESGYPKKIRDDWSGLDDNIDAAVTWTDNDKTYFFKGDEYWKFENMEPDSGYPRKLRDGFSGIPNNVDAAFLWGGNGKIYFFKVMTTENKLTVPQFRYFFKYRTTSIGNLIPVGNPQLEAPTQETLKIGIYHPGLPQR